MIAKSFVYALVDPETKMVFYVGQSRVGMFRPMRHLRKGWVYDVHVLEVVPDPGVIVAERCPWLPPGRRPRALTEAERWWVAYGFCSGWPLRNKTLGGEWGAVNRSPMSLEQRAKISASKKNPSSETRARISAATKRQFSDPDARARFSAAQRAKPPMSDSTRAKVSAASSGRKQNPETIKKRIETRNGNRALYRARFLEKSASRPKRVVSAETRMRMSVSAKLRGTYIRGPETRERNRKSATAAHARIRGAKPVACLSTDSVEQAQHVVCQINQDPRVIQNGSRVDQVQTHPEERVGTTSSVDLNK